MLVIHGIGGNLHFYISPRGVCLIEDLGIDRGITFEHNPYNMQENGADDTFTINDLTVIGRVPTKTVVHVALAHNLADSAIDISSSIGKSIPLSVKVYNATDNSWLINKGAYGLFNVGRETKTVQITAWNQGEADNDKDVEIHIDYEDIILNTNLKHVEDTTSINAIGRYKKTIEAPQFNSQVSFALFTSNLLGLSKNINKRYKVKAPFLVNFIRENHKVTVKNAIKGIDATNQIIKSIHWHYPKNETIIEVGEHQASAYDLVVKSNEAIHALKSQSLKSMNREL